MVQTCFENSSSLSFRVLTDDQVEEIKRTVFFIMEKVGFKVLHETARQMLRREGAIVENETVKPGKGAAVVREHLTNYRDAVEYVHRETVRCINEGKTVDEAVAEIHLPERLARLDYLQENYGKVEWCGRTKCK